jgi:hypothetical protein
MILMSRNISILVNFVNVDLFSVLGSNRPDYRWLIVGPERSGSTFHIDPNSTSAWNACIKGSKKWILYPPTITPPGVFPSKDGSEVTAPQSLCEWFLNYYPQIKDAPADMQPIEAVCKAGELLFVPHNWWHAVINLQDSIALTQNFVGMENLANVLKFCKYKKCLVSGYARDDLYTDFINGLKKNNVEIPLHESPQIWDSIKPSENVSFQFKF